MPSQLEHTLSPDIDRASGRGTFTTTLYVMVDIVKGGGRAPGWADFSIKVEYSKRQKVDIATVPLVSLCSTCQREKV
jgi:hypothetical protein